MSITLEHARERDCASVPRDSEQRTEVHRQALQRLLRGEPHVTAGAQEWQPEERRQERVVRVVAAKLPAVDVGARLADRAAYVCGYGDQFLVRDDGGDAHAWTNEPRGPSG